MLLDKSGLRQKTKAEKDSEKKSRGGFRQVKGKTMSPEELRQKAIEMADKTGIGYDQYKKEVDEIRAARIRAQNELKHKK